MELIIYRDIQAESIGLIRQKVEKHGEEYHYIEVTHKINGVVFPTLKAAIEHYDISKINIEKALNNMGLTYQVL
jgi:hypothetical protein